MVIAIFLHKHIRVLYYTRHEVLRIHIRLSCDTEHFVLETSFVISFRMYIRYQQIYDCTFISWDFLFLQIHFYTSLFHTMPYTLRYLQLSSYYIFKNRKIIHNYSVASYELLNIYQLLFICRMRHVHHTPKHVHTTVVCNTICTGLYFTATTAQKRFQ